jgi:hypothetical protein
MIPHCVSNPVWCFASTDAAVAIMTPGFTLLIVGELARLPQDDQYPIHHEDVRGRPESSTHGGCSEGKGDRYSGPPMALQFDDALQLLREQTDQLPAE